MRQIVSLFGMILAGGIDKPYSQIGHKMELTLGLLAGLIVLGAVCEYLDTTLGMGYGTIMSPMLLLMGFEPLEIVPAILLSEFVSGLVSGILFHQRKHVHFGLKFPLDFSFKKPRLMISRDLSVALVLIGCGLLGPLAAALGAVMVNPFWQSLYIGILVISMGLYLLSVRYKHFSFSWKRIMTLGFIASFNKGFSGGGYGPLVMGGQLLCGIPAKNALGISGLTEGFTSLAGLLAYAGITQSFPWELAAVFVLSSLIAMPFALKSVGKIHPQNLKVGIALFSIVLGSVTLGKLLFA